MGPGPQNAGNRNGPTEMDPPKVLPGNDLSYEHLEKGRAPCVTPGGNYTNLKLPGNRDSKQDISNHYEDHGKGPLPRAPEYPARNQYLELKPEGGFWSSMLTTHKRRMVFALMTLVFVCAIVFGVAGVTYAVYVTISKVPESTFTSVPTIVPTSVPTTKSGPCPSGFKYNANASRCYAVILEKFTWEESRQQCADLYPNAHLAVVTSETQNDAIVKYLRSLNYSETRNCDYMNDDGMTRGFRFYTSGQRRVPNNCTTKDFVWRPKAGIEIPLIYNYNYTNWGPIQPDCFNYLSNLENCLHYWQYPIAPGNWSNWEYKWNDIICNVTICPLCQYDL